MKKLLPFSFSLIIVFSMMSCSASLKSSEGLSLELNSNQDSYCVNGIGTCTDTNIVVPSTYERLPVTRIGDFAFVRQNIESVMIPHSGTSIGNQDFIMCKNLKSVTIPASVTSIDTSAFNSCDNLDSITIPNSVETVGDDMFCDCDNLTSITLPDSITVITDGMFDGCPKLVNVTLPDNVTKIGNGKFNHCDSLTNIKIPNGVTIIDKYAFFDCETLKNISYDETKAEWERIEKGNDWYSGSLVVQCSDGYLNI